VLLGIVFRAWRGFLWIGEWEDVEEPELFFVSGCHGKLSVERGHTKRGIRRQTKVRMIVDSIAIS
jgi:hypothetical protein